MKKFGIEPLDNLLGGGLDDTSLNVIAGKTGTGKTILASQWIVEGVKNKEICVYVSTHLPLLTLEKHIKKFKFINNYFYKINWYSVDIDSKMFLPATQEKIYEWFSKHIDLDLGKIDRFVFDTVSCIMRSLGDAVLFRRVLKEFIKIFYENNISAILIDDMETCWPITFGSSECVLFLNIMPSASGKHQRFLRIIKRYGSDHPLDWIPFKITENGIELENLKSSESYE